MLLSVIHIVWTFIHSIRFYQIRQADPEMAFDLGTAVCLAFQLSPHAFIVGGFALVVGIQLVNWGMMAVQNKRYFEELFLISSVIYGLQNQHDRH